ncbi:MAG: hypothetical protein JWO13_2752 [Acidobacteriales bacterium]|nr:hypothetical protein [Terriglobales bacterium]
MKRSEIEQKRPAHEQFLKALGDVISRDAQRIEGESTQPMQRPAPELTHLGEWFVQLLGAELEPLLMEQSKEQTFAHQIVHRLITEAVEGKPSSAIVAAWVLFQIETQTCPSRTKAVQ